MDTKAFFKLSYGLYLVSSTYQGKDSGCIINTMMQVTANPAKVTITLSKENYTTSLIDKSKVFNGAVLLDAIDMDIIRRFGFQSGKDVDKFKDIEYVKDRYGIKRIKDGIAADFCCKVIDQKDVGTHIMFIAEVMDATVYNEEPVLLYANYHKKKNGVTPPKAPSYQEVTKKGYRCKVCGYVLEADVLPEDYICPVCKQPASVFEKVE